ncbi:MAG: hypothetical protein AABZ40_08040, partial [Thermodesulfobacteriota bacterium]
MTVHRPVSSIDEAGLFLCIKKAALSSKNDAAACLQDNKHLLQFLLHALKRELSHGDGVFL